MIMFWLACIGFISLTLLICFYFPRCCALFFFIFLFFKSGFFFKQTYEAIIMAIVFAIFAAVVIYLDAKNLRLNPFDPFKR